jgi:beta-mannanase
LKLEVRRIELLLKRIHFFGASKVNDLQAAQSSVASVVTAAGLARHIGQVRSAADSATLAIVTHATIRQKLRDAEDAVRGGDPQAAGDRLTEAQSKLTEAQNDVQQTALATMLSTQLAKMLTERGQITPPPDPQATTQTQIVGKLEQKPWRIGPIRDLIDQLARDMPMLGKLDARDKLDVERDLYIADIWTEYVEPRVHADPNRYT